jgi:thiol-disulfide isomerase/thioredoxin
MHRQNVLAIALLIFASVVVVTVGYAKGWGPLGVINAGVARATGRSGIVSAEPMVPANEAKAPEFAPGTWINSDAKTLQSLRGRVVLIEFWTFGCYNCRNTLPYMKRWHDQYSAAGLTVVGVHSPEFSEERNVDNVRSEVASLGIKYPVITDNDYKTWDAYKVQAWPTIFVVDREGWVRRMYVGEGEYEETERTIQKLLLEDQKSAVPSASSSR